MHHRIVAISFISFLLLPIFSISQECDIEIKVAIYDSIVEVYTEEVKNALFYSWKENDTRYEIIPVVIDKKDVIGNSLTNKNFDVFIVPGSARPYFDAHDLRWKKSVKKFVENGGGYIGICGGANLASMGFQEKFSPNSIINLSVLEIANVYVNDQQMEEWQYLWKSNWQYGLPPINIYLPKTKNPIFKGFYNGYRNIRYGGGPGMYPAASKDEKCGEVIPIAIYAEEPMEVAPIHFWKWRNGWEIAANVTTDIKGQYAAIATTYGKGRIVLFSPHPEKKTFFGGHVEEFPVRPKAGPFTWFIYNWSGGIPSEESYNWWILRRAVAWAAAASIPPASNLSVFVEGVGKGMYFNGREIVHMNEKIVVGNIDMVVRGIGGEGIKIYVDGKLKHCTLGNLYSGFLNIKKGKHVVKIETWRGNEKAFYSFTIIGISYV